VFTTKTTISSTAAAAATTVTSLLPLLLSAYLFRRLIHIRLGTLPKGLPKITNKIWYLCDAIM